LASVVSAKIETNRFEYTGYGKVPWQRHEGTSQGTWVIRTVNPVLATIKFAMPKARARVWLVSLGVSVATAILMLATEPRMAIAWDEGFTLGREARIRDWFRALRDPGRFAADWRPVGPTEDLVQGDGTLPPRRDQVDTLAKLLFDRRVVEWFWPFAREEPHGHPPFFALVGLAGDVLAPSWQDLPRARLGPILVFSLTARAIFQFVVLRWGVWAAALAAGAWVLQPNLFGHGHYAGWDALLSSLWVLAVFFFTRATDATGDQKSNTARWGWILGFGLVLGCSLATKLTGWFLFLPFLSWAAVYRSRQACETVFLGLIVAMIVLCAMMPPWWTDPIDGLERFLRSNLTRSATIAIRIQFLGTVYDTPSESLPWYNTLVWTVLVTPVGFLVLAGAGLWFALRHWRSEPIAILIAGNWAFLIILRGLPHTPGHDGVRLFLPAFGALALLAGLGARYSIDRWGRWAKVAIAFALHEGVISIAVMMPVPLSYFSPIVGGLPGATALGMEPTYYWDTLDPESRR
jgi:Dolichyl-phosphate-mannose-protein mannosyltransferase